MQFWVWLPFRSIFSLHLFFSYVRMLKSPALYGVGADYQEDDHDLIQERADIAHSAAVLLEKCQLIKYDRQSGRFTSIEPRRIASYYYVTYNSMMVYNQHLRPMMSMIELFRVFALSNEFKLLPVGVFIYIKFLLQQFNIIFFFHRFVRKRSWSLRSYSSASRYLSRRVSKNLARRSMYCCRRISRNSS